MDQPLFDTWLKNKVEVNIIRRLLITLRQHACSIHINTQYQIMDPTCKQLTGIWVSLTTGHYIKCPKCTKCFVLGKLVYQNMLFSLKCWHAPCGIVSVDSRRSEVILWWSVVKWGPRKTFYEWINTPIVSSIVVARVFTPQLSCPVNWHFWGVAEQRSTV